MKKLIVVVDKEIETELTGKDLRAMNPTDKMGVLVVNDGAENIAVFHDWLYWKKVD